MTPSAFTLTGPSMFQYGVEYKYSATDAEATQAPKEKPSLDALKKKNLAKAYQAKRSQQRGGQITASDDLQNLQSILSTLHNVVAFVQTHKQDINTLLIDYKKNKANFEEFLQQNDIGELGVGEYKHFFPQEQGASYQEREIDINNINDELEEHLQGRHCFALLKPSESDFFPTQTTMLGNFNFAAKNLKFAINGDQKDGKKPNYILSISEFFESHKLILQFDDELNFTEITMSPYEQWQDRYSVDLKLDDHQMVISKAGKKAFEDEIPLTDLALNTEFEIAGRDPSLPKYIQMDPTVVDSLVNNKVTLSNDDARYFVEKLKVKGFELRDWLLKFRVDNTPIRKLYLKDDERDSWDINREPSPEQFAELKKITGYVAQKLIVAGGEIQALTTEDDPAIAQIAGLFNEALLLDPEEIDIDEGVYQSSTYKALSEALTCEEEFRFVNDEYQPVSALEVDRIDFDEDSEEVFYHSFSPLSENKKSNYAMESYLNSSDENAKHLLDVNFSGNDEISDLLTTVTEQDSEKFIIYDQQSDAENQLAFHSSDYYDDSPSQYISF